MNRPPEPGDLDRRTVLLLGLAGASTLVLGTGDRMLAGESTGMDMKVIKETASMIPGFPKVHLREATYQQGADPKTRRKILWSVSVPKVPSKSPRMAKHSRRSRGTSGLVIRAQ
jgi:hypothetical protein